MIIIAARDSFLMACVQTQYCIHSYYSLTHVIFRLPNLTALIYDAMASFFVSHKGVDPKWVSMVTLNARICHTIHTIPQIKQPFDASFFAKGLVFDGFHGNFIRLSANGAITAAAHGTAQINVCMRACMDVNLIYLVRFLIFLIFCTHTHTHTHTPAA